MWLVPTCVTRRLNVVIAHVYGGGCWKCLVPTCVAIAIGCDWYPRVWWCQLDVVCAACVAVAAGCDPGHTRVAVHLM